MSAAVPFDERPHGSGDSSDPFARIGASAVQLGNPRHDAEIRLTTGGAHRLPILEHMYEDGWVKVLVATSRTQGMRYTDYFSCIEGEIVHFGHVCGPAPDPERLCGCGHVFAGLNSHQGSTTAEVRELEFTPRDLAEALRASLIQRGFDPSGADEEADRIIRMAAVWPVGIVLERYLGGVGTRL